MSSAVLVFLSLLVAAAAGFLALYAFGRLAGRVRPAPSYALPVAGPATALDELVGSLDARQGRDGLMLLADNLDAFAVRALTARRAGRSLDLQYYYWREDLTGRLLAHEVMRAAQRGVRVRLLLDDINAHGHDRRLLALSAHPNVEVRLFNPSRTRASVLVRGLEMLVRAFSATRRMHNKAWIADGRLAVLGGRNIGDAYFDAHEDANFRDLDVLLVGPSVRATEAIFDAFWNSAAAVPITAFGRWRAGDLSRLRDSLAAAARTGRAGPYLQRVAEDGSVLELRSGKWPLHWAEARVVSDPPEKVQGGRRADWLIGAITPLLRSARASLTVVSPYFIPGEAGTRQLVELAARGVRVSVLTNSLAATDVAAVHGAYARYRRALIEGGVRLFELKPYDRWSARSLFGSRGASLHTKAFAVDGRLGFVGSMNFDPRSISLNSEMGLIVEHEAVARELEEIFADEMSPRKSYRVALEGGRIVWRDLSGGRGGVFSEEPEAGLWRRLAAGIIGLLPLQSQL